MVNYNFASSRTADCAFKRLLVAAPRGFCAGVQRAVSTVEAALSICGPPVYVRKQIVHNRLVVDRLRQLGAIFVDELSEVPGGANVIFSAHGVSPEVRKSAELRGMQVIDATCPLVTKVHLEALMYNKVGLSVLLIGYPGHDEVEGVMGELPGLVKLVTSVEDAESVQVTDPNKVGVITQTTLSLDDALEIMAVLRRRFTSIRTPATDDICYATQNRQAAVRVIAAQAEVVVVFGSPNSSNATRLCEIARNSGAAACLVEDINALDVAKFDPVNTLGLTASASTNESVVQQSISVLGLHGFMYVSEVSIANEKITFSLPTRLTNASLVSIQDLRSSGT